MQTRTPGTGSLDEQKAWDKYFGYLLKTLTDADAGARARSARLLGENREQRAAPALNELLLDDPDMAVRESAAAALGQMGAVEAPDQRPARPQRPRAPDRHPGPWPNP